MDEDNKFHQYGYNHYLKAPTRPNSNAGKNGGSSGHVVSVRSRLMRDLQKPAFASVALIVAAALFVGLIMITYPSDDDTHRNIPIIKADLSPIKTQPLERGGMSIPHSDSTIMARVGGDSIEKGLGEVENLLERATRKTPTISLIGKEDAIERAMAQNPMDDTAPIDIKEPDAKAILQKIGSSSKEVMNETDNEFSKKTAMAAIMGKPDRPKIYAAATAPDTLDFVRKILDEKASKVSSIEPAVGAANPAADITPGSYFVQLASITDRTRASAEWAKMQARYNVLSSSKFRVQEASLSSGKFYRIQAGPMSKLDANRICDALKAQNKAGGCIVVK